VLAGLAAAASIAASSYHGILNMGVGAVTAALLDFAVMRLQQRKRLLPDGALLTGLIIGLVVSPSVSWMIVLLASAIAIASKHLLALRKRPIFNPAAFGLLAVLLLFPTGQDWWGAMSDLSVWYLPLLLAGGYWITFRVNKFALVFAFLGLYFSAFLAVALLGVADVGDMFRVPFVNSVLFLSFFMLTDPPTSPGKTIEQVSFAIVAAGISVWTNLSIGGETFLLTGLLAANLWHSIVSLIKRKSGYSRQPAGRIR
jgi:Na+-translocating ferredoxin:NAD+ oxidoreductase RnfD subunit